MRIPIFVAREEHGRCYSADEEPVKGKADAGSTRPLAPGADGLSDEALAVRVALGRVDHAQTA